MNVININNDKYKKKLLKKIFKLYKKIVEELLINNSFYEKEITIEYLIYKEIDIKKGLLYLKILKECNCCERHTINFPNNINTELKIKENMEQNIKKCKCKCRHIARFIVRTFQNKENL